MSCLSLAQLMVGGGTLWTSHGKMASSPAITDILIGSTEPPLSDLGRTGHPCNSIQNVCDKFIWGKKKKSLKIQTRSSLKKNRRQRKMFLPPAIDRVASYDMLSVITDEDYHNIKKGNDCK